MFERFSRHARAAVVSAGQSAHELDADRIRPEHLVLGVLQAAGADLTAVLSNCGVTAEAVRRQLPAHRLDDGDDDALRSIGIDVDAVREKVDQTFGPDTFDNALRRPKVRGCVGFSKPSKKVMELALREALAHKHNWIGCEHMVLGLLRCGDDVALGLLTARVDAAELRRRVDTLFDAAA
ncbi:Clp protease N-terminal domain-containing protein [Mycolicibacterium vaccae]|uniref:Clp protease N-terminal domain-containing protein n=1 Tax=Mycolicibacterium vaccae TaxID=1810 RepID=UPI003CE72B0C